MANQFTQYLSLNEITEILGISRTRFYALERAGLIRKAPNPLKMRKNILYIAEDVKKLEQDVQKYSDYKTINELRKKYDTTHARLLRLCFNHSIEYEIVTDSIFGKGEKKIFSPDSVKKLDHYFDTDNSRVTSNRARLKDFKLHYDIDRRIALFQPFFSASFADELMRVTKINGEWGFVGNFEGKENTFITFEAAKSYYGFFQVYDIDFNKPSSYANEPLPAQLLFELDITNNEHMKIIDFFYKVLGIKNVRIEAHATKPEIIYMYVVKEILRLDEQSKKEINLDLWNRLLLRGEIAIAENELFLISPIKRTTVLFDLDVFKNVSNMVSKHPSKSVNSVINEALRYYF